MRTKVRLHGAMARAVGRSDWDFEISYPAEIFHAIDANTNGRMMAFLYDNLNTEFRIVLDGKDITNLSQLSLSPVKEIQVMPVLRGAGSSGLWTIIVGVLIIAAVLIIPGAGVAAGGGAVSGFTAVTSATATLTATAGFFLSVGIGLTLAGIAQLIAPTNKLDNSEKPENKPSYIFNGAINTYRQGNPVPVCLGGPFECGSQIISAGVRSVDIKD